MTKICVTWAQARVRQTQSEDEIQHLLEAVELQFIAWVIQMYLLFKRIISGSVNVFIRNMRQ